MPTTRSRTYASRAPRRKLVWARNITGPNTGDLRYSPLVSFYAASGLTKVPGVTIARMRGAISINPASGVSGGLAILGARVTDAADIVAPIATTNPGTDLHNDWMLFMPVQVPYPTADDPDQITTYFDVKAARKMEEVGQDLSIFVDVAPTTTWSLVVSILLMLP